MSKVLGRALRVRASPTLMAYPTYSPYLSPPRATGIWLSRGCGRKPSRSGELANSCRKLQG